MIYLASSRKNIYLNQTVTTLRANRFSVYDFREDAGFAWAQIDPNWESWNIKQYKAALEHPLATHGAGRDLANLTLAKIVILVLPTGNSAHLELGYGIAKHKKSYIYVPEGSCRPDLMYGLAHGIFDSLEDLMKCLK